MSEKQYRNAYDNKTVERTYLGPIWAISLTSIKNYELLEVRDNFFLFSKYYDEFTSDRGCMKQIELQNIMKNGKNSIHAKKQLSFILFVGFSVKLSIHWIYSNS